MKPPNSISGCSYQLKNHVGLTCFAYFFVCQCKTYGVIERYLSMGLLWAWSMQALCLIVCPGFPTWPYPQSFFMAAPKNSYGSIKDWGSPGYFKAWKKGSSKVLLFYGGECFLWQHLEWVCLSAAQNLCFFNNSSWVCGLALWCCCMMSYSCLC